MIAIFRNLVIKIANMRALRKINFSSNLAIYSPLFGKVQFSQTEPWMLETLRFLVQRHGGGLLDIGVNIGQTMAAYKIIDPEGLYIGIEPNPDCASFANQIAEVNGFTNVTIVPAALSDVSGLIKLDFYQDNDTDSSASIIQQFRHDRPIIRSKFIASITGADFLRNFDCSSISIIKIDVEGAEAIVISQLDALLKLNRPVVTVEILPAYSSDNVARIKNQKQIEAVLEQHNYDLVRIQHDRSSLLGFKHLHKIGVQSEINKSDYILVPTERLDDLREVVKQAGLPFEERTAQSQ
jgi:FkbM family methyltransferase